MTTLLPADEFAALDFPNPPYLVEPMIPLGGLALIYSKPNVGKSQFLLTLADAISNGTPLFNRWPTTQGPVIFIQADMTSQMQQERLTKILTTTTLSNTYFVVEEDGSTPLIDIKSLSLLKQDLVALMREINPVLTIWDTLRTIHSLSENSDEAPKIVYTAAKRILPSSTHIFAHHTRKQSRDPDADEHLDEGFLGHQHWKSMPDAHIYLAELGTSPKRLSCTFTKSRTAPDFEKKPFPLEMDLKTMRLNILQ